jgi:hypothetical protein
MTVSPTQAVVINGALDVRVEGSRVVVDPSSRCGTDLIGSFRFNHNEFVGAVDLVSDRLDLPPLHTLTMNASEAPRVFELACEPTAMKVRLDFAST